MGFFKLVKLYGSGLGFEKKECGRGSDCSQNETFNFSVWSGRVISEKC